MGVIAITSRMKLFWVTLFLAMTIAVGRRGSRGKGRHHGGGYWGWNKPRNFCQTSLRQTCNPGEYYFEQIIGDADLCNRQCPPLPYKTCRNNDNSPNRICINQTGNLTGFTVCSYCKSWQSGIRNLSGRNICSLSCENNFPSTCTCV